MNDKVSKRINLCGSDDHYIVRKRSVSMNEPLPVMNVTIEKLPSLLVVGSFH
ncbi:hypothetical protein ACFFJI_02100 [Allobacillus sp. GCM10007491]|uniref:Uncharacterized protein n=1 Tax=Allobacillus saliphilus TaxID=2912308 RepID=A0A941CUQ8_9BACI|nr:hypothetical protein [Allobacillus saliphilus]MBR7554323.1 hypothetical protein [Allobacillus saliphilus]